MVVGSGTDSCRHRQAVSKGQKETGKQMKSMFRVTSSQMIRSRDTEFHLCPQTRPHLAHPRSGRVLTLPDGFSGSSVGFWLGWASVRLWPGLAGRGQACLSWLQLLHCVLW